MGWLEFSEKVIGHFVTLVVAFAWPVVAAVLIFTQRVAIAALIDRVKTVSAGKDGLKVDMDPKLQAVTNDVAQAKLEEAAKPAALAHDGPAFEMDAAVEPPEEHRDAAKYWLRASEFLQNAPPVVIHHAWMEVRGALYRLLGLEKTATDWWSLDGLQNEKLVARAKVEGKLDGKLLEAVTELMMIYNDSTVTIGWQPTQAQAATYMKNALEVTELILAAAKKRAA